MTAGPGRVLHRYLLTSLLVFVLGSMTAACVHADIELPQADGSTLVLPAPAQRIITLAPNLAEIIFAAGAGDRLEAVVEYSNFPPEVSGIPRVGDAFRIDLERIVTFEPDLVIAWHSGNPQAALEKLRQLGITVWQVEISRPEEIAEAVENVSMAAGTAAVGAKVAEGLRKKLAILKQENFGKAPVNYFYQVASHPLYTVNGQHIISEGLKLCGGNNVFSGLGSLAPQVSREAVILADPDVMIAARDEGNEPSLDTWKQWPRLRAVANGHLFYLPADEISQATPRFLDSIALACRHLDEVRSAEAAAVDVPLDEIQNPGKG